MPSNVRPQDATDDFRNLLHALPHPTAVFTSTDGKLLAANKPFWNELSLSGGESRSGNGQTGSFPLHVRIINENSVHFETAGGFSRFKDADVQPIRCEGQDCWLVSPSTENKPSVLKRGDFGIEHYRALLENLNEIIYANDRNAVVQYVSPNIYRLTGFEAHEVIGRSFTEFVHPDDLEGRIDVFLKILGGEEQVTEYRMITKAGEIKWARTNARPIIENGEVIGIQGALVDITDRKEIEEALRQSEEKYRNVVQNSKDAIFVIQGEHIRFMNPTASEILGYHCESIADRPFWEFIHPDDRDMMLERYHLRLSGRSVSDRVDFRILNR